MHQGLKVKFFPYIFYFKNFCLTFFFPYNLLNFVLVISVRATKPVVPASVMNNFLDLEIRKNEIELQKIENQIRVIQEKNQREVAIIKLSIEKLQQDFKRKIDNMKSKAKMIEPLKLKLR
jgi:hypothetical protein